MKTARIELRSDAVTRSFLERIPRDFAREHLVVSQWKEASTTSKDRDVCLVIGKQVSPAVLHNINAQLGEDLEAIQLSGDECGEQIARIIDEAYSKHAQDEDRGPRDRGGGLDGNGAGEVGRQNGRVLHDISGESADGLGDAYTDPIEQLLERADRELLSTGGKGPIVLLVDRLLFEALGERASDLHVQPLADQALVRYRIDGVLHDRHELTPRLTLPVVSRIKVMGRMDIAERRIAQDGRASVTIAGRPVDLRISTIPTSYGERAVIRLLDHSHQLCDFDQLGMPDDVAQSFADRASRGNGIILVTGPTGSGKTTTLYSTLRRISSRERNIMTIEDPIEYELSSLGTAISQAQVNAKKGLTFSTGLRHILRQDPDVIMVGEIRDVETARIAIQSSLTGHLVFSTLHTNDAPSAVTRLIDLGVEPYLASASLSAVLAQRLVRRVHAECNGHGCDECHQTGLRGRCGLFELMLITEPMRELISHNARLSEIREMAKSQHLRSLREEGERLIRAGITMRSEVTRVVDVM